MSDIVFSSRKKVRIVLDEFSIKKEEQKHNFEEQLKAVADSEYQRGYQECLQEMEAEYLQKREAEMDQIRQCNNNVIADFEDQLNQLEAALPGSILELSILIAEKIIHSHVEISVNVRDQIESALKKVTGAADITVKVNPKDLELLSGQFNHVKLVNDENIERGGCLVETEIGNVDARVNSQLSELQRSIEAILNGEQ